MQLKTYETKLKQLVYVKENLNKKYIIENIYSSLYSVGKYILHFICVIV